MFNVKDLLGIQIWFRNIKFSQYNIQYGQFVYFDGERKYKVYME